MTRSGPARCGKWPGTGSTRVAPSSRALFRFTSSNQPTLREGNDANASTHLAWSFNRFDGRRIYSEPVGRWLALLLVSGPQRGRRIRWPMACLQDVLRGHRDAAIVNSTAVTVRTRSSHKLERCARRTRLNVDRDVAFTQRASAYKPRTLRGAFSPLLPFERANPARPQAITQQRAIRCAFAGRHSLDHIIGVHEVDSTKFAD
jgi:hypothetical protein